MLPAVAQTVVLSALGMIMAHHFLSQTTDYFTNSPTFSNFTQSMDALNAVTNSTQAESAYQVNVTETQDNTTITYNNFTLSTNTTDSSKTSTKKSFYKSEFPTELFLLCILTPLSYYWQIWLEKTFPGRLRAHELPEKPMTDELDDREEAIVQKWIAQGKVKRASLSWWNTFMKWTLDMTLGNLWVVVMSYLYELLWEDWTLKTLRKNSSWTKWVRANDLVVLLWHY